MLYRSNNLNPSLTISCTLFVDAKTPLSFRIKQIHALFQKHPGGGRVQLPPFKINNMPPLFVTGSPESPSTHRLVAESLGSARLSLRGFFFSILRWRRRLQRTQKPLRDSRDFIDRRQKRVLIRLRWLCKPANLPYKLQRSGANLFIRNRRVKIEQRLDIPAHECDIDIQLLFRCKPHRSIVQQTGGRMTLTARSPTALWPSGATRVQINTLLAALSAPCLKAAIPELLAASITYRRKLFRPRIRRMAACLLPSWLLSFTQHPRGASALAARMS